MPPIAGLDAPARTLLHADAEVRLAAARSIEEWLRDVPASDPQALLFVGTRLVPPKYGDSSGVRGAAWLWDD